MLKMKIIEANEGGSHRIAEYKIRRKLHQETKSKTMVTNKSPENRRPNLTVAAPWGLFKELKNVLVNVKM